MPSSLSNPKVRMKKPLVKKQWKAAPSKPSAISAKKAKPSPPLETLQKLKINYPDAHCELLADTPFQLLAATILSAQCTDERVNQVTPHLFARFPDASSLSRANLEEVEDLVRSTGFFKNKAKNLIGMAQKLMDHHQGQVPRSLPELIALPGVGRKTANVVLGNSFGIQSGIVVDTHVGRLSQRLGWTQSSDPVKIEMDLIKFVPQEDWTYFSHLLIFHGRRICKARKPNCESCFLFDLCPKRKV
jgi:endonuclease-3